MSGLLGAQHVADGHVAAALSSVSHRGRDVADVVTLGPFQLGVVRYADRADGLNRSPVVSGRVTLTIDGRCWNASAISADLKELGHRDIGASESEIVAAALDAWGTEALQRLDGSFALAWYDGSVTRLARDRFGEVPLHWGTSERGHVLWSSELKGLLALGADPGTCRMLRPGSVLELSPGRQTEVVYYDLPCGERSMTREDARTLLRDSLERSVGRLSRPPAPVAVLLSGGIDSAVVAAMLRPSQPDIVAYTAVMDPRNPDLDAARECAASLCIPLREVQIPLPTRRDLSAVVRAIEMPSKVQVEIGWPTIFLARAMHADGFRVAFAGENSDALWASFGLDFHGIRKHGWYEHRRRHYVSSHAGNNARANKIMAAYGIEYRLPFVDRSLAELALSMSQDVVTYGKRATPKAVLQHAVSDLLPASIVRRRKLAMQDGLGMKLAAKRAVGKPCAFYRAEYQRQFGVKG